MTAARMPARLATDFILVVPIGSLQSWLMSCLFGPVAVVFPLGRDASLHPGCLEAVGLPADRILSEYHLLRLQAEAIPLRLPLGSLSTLRPRATVGVFSLGGVSCRNLRLGQGAASSGFLLSLCLGLLLGLLTTSFLGSNLALHHPILLLASPHILLGAVIGLGVLCLHFSRILQTRVVGRALIVGL